MNRTSCQIAALLSLSAAARADVRVSDLFADYMVLQHGVPMRIWGHASANESVTVTLNGKNATTTAGQDGK